MSDSEDFLDDNATEESENEVEPTQPRITGGKRGKDLPWQELKTFPTTKDFNESELATDIKSKFSARAIRESDATDTIRYTCKFARKVGWQACPMMLRVKFMAHCDEVLVEQYGNAHVHEEDTDDVHQGVNFKWTDAMTESIKNSLKNEASAATILRNLKDDNLIPKENGPTPLQLNNKISYCRKLLRKTEQIFTTGDLRSKINQHLAIPDDDCESYIAYHKIDDEDEKADPRFTIIWTSKKLLARIKGELTQDDATYRYKPLSCLLCFMKVKTFHIIVCLCYLCVF